MIHAFKQIRLNGSNVVVTGAGVLQVGAESVVYQSQTGNLASTSYVNNVSGSIDTRLQSLTNWTGTTPNLYYPLNSNPSGYLTSANAGGIQSINVTGSTLSGAITYTGAGNILLTRAGQVITFSGNTGAYANFATTTNLATTGSTLDGKINTLSGYSNTTFATVTNLASTGSTLDSKVNTLSGYTNNTFSTITNLASTGSTLDTKINTLSGYTNNTFATIVNLASTGSNLQTQISSLNTWTGRQLSFITGINPTGFDNYFVNFPVIFSSIPKVLVTVEITGDVMYAAAVRNRNVSGYTVLFSDTISELGVSLHTIATIN